MVSLVLQAVHLALEHPVLIRFLFFAMLSDPKLWSPGVALPCAALRCAVVPVAVAAVVKEATQPRDRSPLPCAAACALRGSWARR